MRRLTLPLLALGLATMAHAADEKTSNWSGESELGYVWKSGNTQSETLNAKQRVVFDARPWTNTFIAEASNTVNSEVNTVSGKKEKARIGERYLVSDQVDYFVAKHTYTFGRASWEKDRFNGFEYRASWVLGVGHDFFDTGTFKLKGELGAGEAVDVIEEDLGATPIVNKQRRRDTLGHFFEELTWKFSTNAELGQSLRTEYTNFNTYSRFDVYIKSMLIANVAMKAAYTLRYNTDVPKDSRHKDEEFTLSLSYNF